MIIKNFVHFVSPGTFVAEETVKPIDAWDVDEALSMARTVTERHNATPFGFFFTTRTRADEDLDSKESAKSGMYFLGGEVRTVDDVRKAALPEERVLLSNMEGNGWSRIITNRNSWKWSQPLRDEDTVLPWPPREPATAEHSPTGGK